MQTVFLNQMRENSYSMRESLRALKTNLQFCGDDIKTIMVTSTAPSEGKSTVVFELARSLTESGKSVLIVDTDMRKSVLVGRLRAKAPSGKINGLSHFLSGQKKLAEVIYSTQVPRLYMVFAGPSVPNTTEILEKQYFERLIESGRNNFDYILIDCAPLGAVIDAAVIAKHCDGAIMIIAQNQVGAKDILSAKKQLEASGVKILGAVLNKVKREKHTYGKSYGGYYGDYGKYGSYGSYGNYGTRDGEDYTIDLTEDDKKGKDRVEKKG